VCCSGKFGQTRWVVDRLHVPVVLLYSSLVHLPPTTCRVPSGSVRQSRWQYWYLRQQSRSVVHDDPYQQSTQTRADRSQILKRRQHSRSLEHTSRKHILSGSSFHGNLSTDAHRHMTWWEPALMTEGLLWKMGRCGGQGAIPPKTCASLLGQTYHQHYAYIRK